MGVVNPSEVHPGILRALYRLYVERGSEFAAATDHLIALLAPTAAVHEGANPRLSVRLSVKEAQTIGMLEPASKSDGRLRLALSTPPDGCAPAAADALFVRELRRIVMAARNNEGLFGEGASQEDGAEREKHERLSTTHAREFTRIQAWVLLGDPRAGSLFFTHHRNAQRNVQLLQDRYDATDLVVNGNRWTNFRRWSLFLGFSRHDHLAGSPKAGIVPDPTRAVRDELESIRSEATEMSLLELRDRLAERLPVLDGGSYRADVRRHVGAREDARLASPSLALALLRCERAKMLRFEARADFGGGTLTMGTRSYSHVRLEEA